MAKDNFDWNEKTEGKLRVLWASGLSTAKIAETMGATKNGIVGKAHRLFLPSRPSPIVRDYPKAAPKPPKAGKTTLAPPILPPPAIVVRRSDAPTYLPPMAYRAAPKPEVQHEPPAPPPEPVYAGRVTECCFPIGEPKARDFRFCDAPTLPGKSYCKEHHDVAFIKVRPSREAEGFKVYGW